MIDRKKCRKCDTMIPIDNHRFFNGKCYDCFDLSKEKII